jgi:hypothetical protein
MNYTSDRPCRCGFDGTGTHRCHFGRPDPHGTGETGEHHCTAPALNKFIATWGSLSGMMPKCSAIAAHYCEEHLELLKPQLDRRQTIIDAGTD